MLSPLISKQHSRREFSLHHIGGFLPPCSCCLRVTGSSLPTVNDLSPYFPTPLNPSRQLLPSPSTTTGRKQSPNMMPKLQITQMNWPSTRMAQESMEKLALQRSFLTSKEQSLRT